MTAQNGMKVFWIGLVLEMGSGSSGAFGGLFL